MQDINLVGGKGLVKKKNNFGQILQTTGRHWLVIINVDRDVNRVKIYDRQSECAIISPNVHESIP